MKLHNFQGSSGLDPNVILTLPFFSGRSSLFPWVAASALAPPLGKSQGMGSCPCSLFPVNGPLGNQAGRSRSSCSQVSQQTNYLAITHAFGWSTHSLSWLRGAAPRLHPKSFTKVLALIYWLTICPSPTSITLLFQLTVFPLEPWHFFNYLRWGSSPNYLILDKKAGAVSVLFLTLYPSPGGSDGKESACNAGNPS